MSNSRIEILAIEALAKVLMCHPEFISGSHNVLTSMDSEFDPELDSGQASE